MKSIRLSVEKFGNHSRSLSGALARFPLPSALVRVTKILRYTIKRHPLLIPQPIFRAEIAN